MLMRSAAIRRPWCLEGLGLSSMEPKLVITAMSSLSCLGKTGADITASLRALPKTGMVQDFGFHTLANPQPCFCISDFEPEAILGKKGLRTKDRATKLLLSAMELGFKEMFETTPEGLRPGICIGTTFGSVQSIGDFLSDAIVNGAHNVNPTAFANTVINAPASNANIRYTSRMSSSTVATGFNAGMDALIYSCNYIRAGHASCMIAGGLEEISFYSLAGCAKSDAVAAGTSMTPFGRGSTGFLPGEGCAVFYIETEENAKARGASVIAEIAGMYSCYDPKHGRNGYNPGASGAGHAVTQACAQAGIGASSIGFVAASANGSPDGDAMEASVIEGRFPDVPVAAYKCKTGECLGASPSLSLACALNDMRNDCISGTTVQYPLAHRVNVVTERIENKKNEFALVNSFSCDGYCASLVLKNRT
jgi:3-oxoacyl-[acyl-carrier-protein] synthase II